MARKELRKKAVVDAKMQWTLAMRVVLHFCTFIVGGAIFGLIAQFLSDPFRGLSGHLQSFWSNNGPYMVALLCLLPVFIRDTLTISNRIVGPICRLRHTVKRLAKDEKVPALQFRKGDMWDDLPEAFNVMVEHLRASGQDSVQATVRELASSQPTGAASTVADPTDAEYADEQQKQKLVEV